jgi:hypothetical protein
MISSLKSEKHYDEEKSKHLEILKEMLERNKDHPSVERG